MTLFSGFGALAVLLAGWPFFPGRMAAADWGWAIAAGSCGGIGAMLIFRALAIGPVSVASPVLCVVGLALPTVVGFARGDRVTVLALLGLLLTPLAIVLLARDAHDGEGRADPRRVLGPAIAAGLVTGGFLVFFAQIRAAAGLMPVVVARLAGIAVLGIGVLARRRPAAWTPVSRMLALASGVFDSAANVTYVLAVQRGSLALVAALVSLSPASAVLLARAVLGERWSGSQRIGFALALAAGVLVSIG